MEKNKTLSDFELNEIIQETMAHLIYIQQLQCKTYSEIAPDDLSSDTMPDFDAMDILDDLPKSRKNIAETMKLIEINVNRMQGGESELLGEIIINKSICHSILSSISEIDVDWVGPEFPFTKTFPNYAFKYLRKAKACAN